MIYVSILLKLSTSSSGKSVLIVSFGIYFHTGERSILILVRENVLQTNLLPLFKVKLNFRWVQVWSDFEKFSKKHAIGTFSFIFDNYS